MNELKVNAKKKVGMGSISLLFSIIAIMFNFTYLDGEERPLGTMILNFMGIYKKTAIVSISLFMLSIYIGNKYKQHLGAKSGKSLSIVFILLIIVLTVLTFMRSYNS